MHLLEATRSLSPDGAVYKVTLSLTKEELDLVDSAIRAVLDDFDRFEFQTRVGETVEAARALLANLSADATGSEVLSSAIRPIGVEGTDKPGVPLGLSEDEVRLAKNALNEVLNGIGVTAIVNRFGEDRIDALMDALDSVLRDVVIAGTRGSSSALR